MVVSLMMKVMFSLLAGTGKSRMTVSQSNAFDIPGEEWNMNGVASSQCLVDKVKYEDIKLVF